MFSQESKPRQGENETQFKLTKSTWIRFGKSHSVFKHTVKLGGMFPGNDHSNSRRIVKLKV